MRLWGTKGYKAERQGQGQLVLGHKCLDISLWALRHMEDSKWSFRISNQAELSGSDGSGAKSVSEDTGGGHRVGCPLTSDKVLELRGVSKN